MLITVAINDDDRSFSKALKKLIDAQPDMGCVASFESIAEAKTYLPVVHPDVLLQDVQMGDGLGCDALDDLLEASPKSSVLMCTAFVRDEYLFRAFKKGAQGYIVKSDAPEKIIEAIRQVHRGGNPMSEPVTKRIVDFFREAPKKISLLSAREIELLGFLAEGCLYKEIADRMGVKMDTVKKHATTIYKKLGVGNRTQAVNLYKRQ